MKAPRFSLLLPALLLAACERGAAQAPHTAAHAGEPGSASPAQQAEGEFAPEERTDRGNDLSRAASAPPPSAGAAPSSEARRDDRAFESKKASADERPGLGTTWGENRTSRVASAPFDRADSENPFATLSLNYNDEPGVRALSRRATGAYVGFDPASFSAARGAVTVRLLDENGSPLPSTRIGGRDYVVGNDAQRYVIEIQNHTGSRFEAVGTVDGLDVIDGRAGSFRKRGYIVGPWSSVEIDGFRRSNASVAAFRFGAVKDSYAARSGDDRNVGVIGVAFFDEQGSSPPWTLHELERREQADPFPGRFAAPPPR
jgi:hypothetical protein